MLTRFRFKFTIIATVLLIVLAACGGEDSEADSPTATLLVETPLATTIIHLTPPATAASTPANTTASTNAPAEYELVDASEDETIPTPDLEQKQREMQPTAVIVEGEYPYPTADSSIDSDRDGFYTIPEVERAVRETFPAYQWPEAYTPTIDDIFVMVDFDRVPPGANFEVPMELTLLGSLNRCAWQQNWLDGFTSQDQVKMDESMRQLRATVLTNPVNVYIISSVTDMYDQAELGDPARLIRHIERNCLGFNRWVESQSSSEINHNNLRLNLPGVSNVRNS